MLLLAGDEIYLYQKGFVHAKTLVAGGKLSIIGTASVDYRSFELNFEVNVLLYDKPIAEKLRQVFFTDLEAAEKIDTELWCRRPAYQQLPESLTGFLTRCCKVFSPSWFLLFLLF